MRPIHYSPDGLVERFRRETVLTLEAIKQTLGTSSTATIFRRLKSLGHRASYSHAGKFHTLEELADFNADGLWHFNEIHFSRHGSLVNTLAVLIENSPMGYFAAELEALVQVRVFNPLTELFRSHRVRRELLAGEYLYLSPTGGSRQRDRRSPDRHVEGAIPGFIKPEAIKSLDTFLAVLDEKQTRLYLGLEAMKLGHGGDLKMSRLTGVNVKTIAKGRRELAAKNITLERVRKAGAGRPAIKKKSNG